MYAGGMLVATYKMKLLKGKNNVKNKIVAALRKYRTDKYEFQKVSRQIRNINDTGADMDSVLNTIDSMSDDIELMKNANCLMYSNLNKIKRRQMRETK